MKITKQFYVNNIFVDYKINDLKTIKYNITQNNNVFINKKI